MKRLSPWDTGGSAIAEADSTPTGTTNARTWSTTLKTWVGWDGAKWTARRSPEVTAITFASTITPNADTTEIANVGQLTGALTVAAPSGTPVDGQNLRFRFVQDATGRAITWNAAFAFGTDITAALVPTTASAKFEVLFTWNTTDSKWRCMAISRGF